MKKKLNLQNPLHKLAEDKLTWIFGTGLFFKFLIFNAIWCSYTTFTPFSHFESYTTALIATLVLLTPYALFHWWKAETILLLLVDALFIANLMYYRTYYTAIPLSSYALAGNLAGFTQSVYDSVRWCDLLFPISSIATFLIFLRKKSISTPIKRLPYLTLICIISLLFGINIKAKGEFQNEYKKIKYSAHLYASGTPMFTLFGSLYYDLEEKEPAFTLQKQKEIQEWLGHKPQLQRLPQDTPQLNNCIVILAESLESWVLNLSVENQEITPYLNKLIKDSTTLYAPHVLTQVKGGRSIDAQLMLLAGLLPIDNGTYSVLYPNNNYYTLPKALKEKKKTHNYLLTVDKKKTWNQAAIAHSFGIDTIISYPDFKLEEAFGNRTRVGDRAFFAQCRQKIENGEVWKPGENVYMQFVTYSGHAPFLMPDELKQVAFSEKIPEIMNNYMTVAHYTDEAIGQFINFLKTRPEYKETLIIITGDHEGLASHRKELCNEPGGEGIVSDKQFTPFIVLNSPVGIHYNKVMGQIDMYPTLLNLLHLENYCWSGMGQSILDPDKKGLAVGSQLNAEGETSAKKELEFAQKAHIISDWIIRFNYFDKTELKNNLIK